MNHVKSFENFKTKIDFNNLKALDILSSDCFAIVSVSKEELSKDENYQRSIELKDYLDSKNYNYIETKGEWNNVEEYSFIVEKPFSITIDSFEKQMKTLINDFEQTSFIASVSGRTFLVTKDSIQNIDDKFKIEQR